MATVIGCDPASLPAALRRYPHWVVWRNEPDAERPKPRKMPYGRDGSPARANDLASFLTFDDARKKYEAGGFDGLGWYAWRSVPYVLIDLDHAVDDSGAALDWAAAILEKFPGAYVELSQSGTGLHIIVRARPSFGTDRDGGKRGDVEVYAGRHYLALTGSLYGDGSLSDVSNVDRTAEVEALCQDVGITLAAPAPDPAPQKADIPSPAAPATVETPGAHISSAPAGADDKAILAALGRGRHGPRLAALYYDGDERRGRGQDSEDDHALIAALCELTPDDAQVERLMLASALKRKKWNERRPGGSWLTYSIANARASQRAGPVGGAAQGDLQAISIADRIRDGLPAPPPVVVPGLAWAGRVTLVAAREGIGKSTLFAEAAAAVTQGRPFLGQGATPAGGVLWVLVEEHETDLILRAIRFDAAKAGLGRLHVLNRPSEALAVLTAEVARLRPRLVIIDTLHAFAGPLVEHASQADDWQTVMTTLDAIARSPAQPGILLAAQASKGTGDYRDSTAIGHGVDVVLTLATFEGDDVTRELRVMKARWPVGKTTYQLVGATPDADGALVGGELVKIGNRDLKKEKAVAKTEDRRTKILRYLAAQAGPVAQDTVKKNAGIGATHVKPVLEDLVREGAAVDVGERNDDGTWKTHAFRITDLGRSRLASASAPPAGSADAF